MDAEVLIERCLGYLLDAPLVLILGIKKTALAVCRGIIIFLTSEKQAFLYNFVVSYYDLLYNVALPFQ